MFKRCVKVYMKRLYYSEKTLSLVCVIETFCTVPQVHQEYLFLRLEKEQEDLN